MGVTIECVADEIYGDSVSDRAERWLREGANTARGRLHLSVFASLCWIAYGVGNLDGGFIWFFGILNAGWAVVGAQSVVRLLRDRERLKSLMR